MLNSLSHGDAISGDAMTDAEEFLVAQLRRDYLAFSAKRYPDARKWAEVQVNGIDPLTVFETIDDLTLYLVQRYVRQVSQRKCPNEVLLLRDIAHDLWAVAEITHQPFTKPRLPVAGVR